MLAALMLVVAAVKDDRSPDFSSARSTAPDDQGWTRHLRAMDEALARRDAAAALRAHQDAHGAVLAAQSWDGMLAVGGAALRLAPAASGPGTARADARRMFLWALVRARGAGSLDGVLRAGEAFAALGDRDMVALSARIAESLSPAGLRAGDGPRGGAIR